MHNKVKPVDRTN